jgi:AbrB family looped-hinge helix DNA binding protein
MSVKVSSKYQVVIPENVRQALDLKPGTQVEVIAKGDIAYLVPVKPLAALRRSLAGQLHPNDVHSVRDKRDRKL